MNTSLDTIILFAGLLAVVLLLACLIRYVLDRGEVRPRFRQTMEQDEQPSRRWSDGLGS